MMQRLPDALFYMSSPDRVIVVPSTPESTLRRHANMLGHEIARAGDPIFRFGESLTYYAELSRNRTRLLLVQSNISGSAVFERVADELGCVPNTVSTNRDVVTINHAFLQKTVSLRGDALEFYEFSPRQAKSCTYDTQIQLQAQRLIQLIANAILVGRVMYCTSAE